MLKLASAGVAAATVLVASLLASCSAEEGARSEPVAAVPQHPDFSGLWFPAGRQQDPQRPEYTQAAQAAADAYAQAFTLDDDPGRYCIWPGMPRAVWGAPFTVEIQQRPQDLTIFWEGYGMYRKIYMADTTRRSPCCRRRWAIPSRIGKAIRSSIETTNLKPYPYMSRMATSSDAQVVERLRLEQRDVNGQKVNFIVNELVLTDPKVYTDADPHYGDPPASSRSATPRVHLHGHLVGRVPERARAHASRCRLVPGAAEPAMSKRLFGVLAAAAASHCRRRRTIRSRSTT